MALDSVLKLDLNFEKNHQKICNLVITVMELKIHVSNIFFGKYVLKCHEKTFLDRIQNWIRNFLLLKYLVSGSEKIVSVLQH
jgi:hypothetical protein